MNAKNEELLDLLAERAVGSLSAQQEARLADLLEAAGLDDSDDIDLAAAAAMNAFAAADAGDGAPMPEGLERKLRADADRYFDSGSGAKAVSDIEAERAKRSRPSRMGTNWAGRLGWAVAAVLAVVVVFGLQRNGEQGAPDPSAGRQALLAAAGTEVVEWQRSEIPAYNSVSGDVVWNDERQEGYLRLTGMPANDPGISQYQLWIVDPERDANPVDGGVFDVAPGTGEVIVPIRAKLSVSDPNAFAITREQPGGVVVSDGPLLVVAQS